MSSIVDGLSVDERIALVRSFGFWVRGPCDEGSPVRYIVVDPHGDEEGLMLAGGEDVLELALDFVADENAEAAKREIVARRTA